MSFWEFRARIEGWNAAQGAEQAKPPTDEEFEALQQAMRERANMRSENG